MDTEVIAKDEDASETESCMESELVELGLVSKDTHGMIGPDDDSGFMYQWGW